MESDICMESVYFQVRLAEVEEKRRREEEEGKYEVYKILEVKILVGKMFMFEESLCFGSGQCFRGRNSGIIILLLVLILCHFYQSES